MPTIQPIGSALDIRALQQGQGLGDDPVGLGQPPDPGVLARQAPGVGGEHRQSTATQRGDVLLGGRVEPHLGVHGGGQQHGRGGGEDRRGEQVVGPSRRDTGQQIRRRGSDHHELRPLPHRDVLDGGGIVEDARRHRSAGNGSQRGSPNESQRRLGGHRLDLVSGFPQSSDDERGLVGSDGTGHPDDDASRFGGCGLWSV